MTKLIISRAIWIFITLADLVACTGLFELFNPKEHDVTFVWNAPHNWLFILLGVACASLTLAAISLLSMGHAAHVQENA